MAFRIPGHIIGKLGGYDRTCWHSVCMFQRSAEFGDTRRTAVSASNTDNGSVASFLNFCP
jgi:hypothetical protein